MKKHQLCFIFLILPYFLIGKTDSLKLSIKIDSIKALIDTSTIDTNTVKHYYYLSGLQRKKRDFKAAIKSSITSEQLSLKIRFQRFIPRIYTHLGGLYRLAGDLKALGAHYIKAIHYYKTTEDSFMIAVNYMYAARYNINTHGKDEIGLQYYDSAGNIAALIDDKLLQGDIYNNIAGVHYNNYNFAKATNILQKALRIWGADTSRKARVHEITIHNNLGILYSVSKDTLKAYESYMRAYKLDSIYKNYDEISLRLMELADIEMRQGNYKSAHKRLTEAIYYIDDDLEYDGAHHIYKYMARLFLFLFEGSKNEGPNLSDEVSLDLAAQSADSVQFYYKKAFDITTQKGQVLEQARILHRLAKYYSTDKNYETAAELIAQSIVLYDSVNALVVNYQVYSDVAAIEAKLKNFEPAYFNLRKFVEIDDSIMTQDQRIEFAKRTTEFEYVKKMLILNQEKEIQKQKEEKQQAIIWFGGAAISLLLLFIIFGYNRYRVTQRQSRIIGTQKKELYNKNTKIMSSINYAQNIQNAILPDNKEISDVFLDSLVLYIPKDVVSGDFYYINQVGNLKFIIVADCTGHGVPGAFMSFICNSMIKRIIEDDLPNNAGSFMNKLSALFESYLTNNNVGLTDGLDISIAMIDTQTNELSFAGSKNPILFTAISGTNQKYTANGQHNLLKPMLSSNNTDFYLINGDEHNVGFGQAKNKFTNHEIVLLKGSNLYLFTDGYANQQGGPDNEKFYLDNFIKLISKNQAESLAEQGAILKKELEAWTNKRKQLDDVCIIGVKI